MNLLLRSGAIIFLGGGGACVIPFMRFSTSSKGTSAPSTVTHSSGSSVVHSQPSSSVSVGSSTPRLQERQTPQTKNITEEAENCSLKFNLDQSLIKSSSPSVKYFAFSCDNKGRHEEIIISTWTIWLPETLLNETKNSLKDEMRVNIKTQTSYATDSSDYYKTTFESSIFTVSSITGTWGSDIAWSDEDEQVYKVKINDRTLEKQEIYLKVKQ